MVEVLRLLTHSDDAFPYEHFVQLSLVVFGMIVLLSLYFVAAPYGRYTRQGWGFLIDGRVAWMLQESPSIIASCSFLFYETPLTWKTHPCNYVMLALYIFHYIYRFVDYSSSLFLLTTFEDPGFIRCA